jgi:hypothetical protein
MRHLCPGRALLATVLAFGPASTEAGKKEEKPVELAMEHAHPSGKFTFRTPAGWTSRPVPARPELYESTDGALVVRFVWWKGEAGYDSLHVDCMAERLAGPMVTGPQVKYEYDFLGGAIGSRRILDSAFEVRYDEPILGHRDWRQRNVTVVGEGQSLCIITHAPRSVWKKSSPTRQVLDGVVTSVTFK